MIPKKVTPMTQQLKIIIEKTHSIERELANALDKVKRLEQLLKNWEDTFVIKISQLTQENKTIQESLEQEQNERKEFALEALEIIKDSQLERDTLQKEFDHLLEVHYTSNRKNNNKKQQPPPLEE
jgi:hypothetical protein